MKFLIDSFPYKPRQTVFYVYDNAVHKGVIAYSAVKCVCRDVDKDKMLIDYCDVYIMPDSEAMRDQPALHCVDSNHVHFMYQSCEADLYGISEKEIDTGLSKLNYSDCV